MTRVLEFDRRAARAAAGGDDGDDDNKGGGRRDDDDDVDDEPPTAGQGRRLHVGERAVILADARMVAVFDLLARLADSDMSVLICGETGVGKENAAYALHVWSGRAAQPFVAFNCAALTETLLDSELFGHEKGAFSGAVGARPGLFEAASGGTLFLDEVGDLSLAAQAKLLRVLETKTVTRVGAVRDRERTVDVRIVAATNRDLPEDVAAGRFRSDLLYRLNAATVIVPPLRDRPADVTALARALLEEACARRGRPAPRLAGDVMRLIERHRWPGNVRELRNAMEYLAATTRESEVEPAHLPPHLTTPSASPSAPPSLSSPPSLLPSAPGDLHGAAAGPTGFRRLADEVRELERRRILEALRATGGVKARAARLIGVPHRTFMSKLKQLGLMNDPSAKDD